MATSQRGMLGALLAVGLGIIAGQFVGRMVGLNTLLAPR